MTSLILCKFGGYIKTGTANYPYDMSSMPYNLVASIELAAWRNL